MDNIYHSCKQKICNGKMFATQNRGVILWGPLEATTNQGEWGKIKSKHGPWITQNQRVQNTLPIIKGPK